MTFAAGSDDAPARPNWALELCGVSRRFGGLWAVNAVSLQVAAGSTHAIIGPNGAGKTTLFALVSGELPLSAGSIRIFEQNVSGWSATRRARSGMGRTYQISNVFTGLTLAENILLALRGTRPAKYAFLSSSAASPQEASEVDGLLASCGLFHYRDERVGALSYGVQRQLELALALAGRPRILLLDEPAAGLSPAERTPMADMIRNLPDDLTVLLIEHDMELALGLADRVTCLHYGEVLTEGTSDEIRADVRVQEVYLGTAGRDA
jgi:branched-chain amino acid transport system ATP-binding protein